MGWCFYGFWSDFGAKMDSRWPPKCIQNPSRNHTFAHGGPFWGPVVTLDRFWDGFGLHLASVWSPFGHLVRLFDRFRAEFQSVFQQVGIISASLLLLIHWFIFRPFISELMDQPTRFHLVSSVRSHAIRSVYFRPLSEFR